VVHRHPLQRLLLVLPLFFAACSTTGWDGARSRVDDLTARVEQVNKAAETMRTRTAEALAQLRALTEGGQDVVAACSRMNQSIGAAEQQAACLRDAVVPMKTAATQVFEQWDRDVAAIANEDLQQRGRARLQRSKERFAAIVAAADAAELALGNFHRALHDHMLFLGHDLNRESLREIRAELLTVAASQKEADTQLDTCMKAAHTYVSAASLPSAGDSPPAAAAK
jgi:hypothetical protein